jgi:hypothetical protein
MAEDPVPSEPFSGQIPRNREKYRDIRAIFAGTVVIEFAQNPFQSRPPVRPPLFDGKKNREF